MTENVRGMTFIAGADLTDKQYTAVRISGNRTVVSAALGEADGILQVGAISGRAVVVGISGVSKALLGGNVNAGDLLTSDASGKLVAVTPNDGNTNAVFRKACARALESGTANSIISVAVIFPSVPVQTS